LNRNNLDEFPLRNLETFAALIQQHRVTEIVLTGTTTDPQLYRHEARLLNWLREYLSPGQPVHFSLHTNGQLALRKMASFNLYDRVCLSFPSFNPETYQKLMGSARVPDLAEIIRQAETPVKVSAVINEHNLPEIDQFLEQCGLIGVKRLVFRRLYGDSREWPILQNLPQKTTYRNNPVYDYHGMEVTYWNFHTAGSTSLNLFSDGTISDHYLLTKAKMA
jgi:hypothetical protein